MIGSIKMAYDNKQLKELWKEFSDVLINYPDEETGEYLDADPDGELDGDWFIFDAGTPRMEIWHWFDDHYNGGLHSLMAVTSF